VQRPSAGCSSPPRGVSRTDSTAPPLSPSRTPLPDAADRAIAPPTGLLPTHLSQGLRHLGTPRSDATRSPLRVLTVLYRNLTSDWIVRTTRIVAIKRILGNRARNAYSTTRRGGETAQAVTAARLARRRW